jgi:hypothetical protein
MIGYFEKLMFDRRDTMHRFWLRSPRLDIVTALLATGLLFPAEALRAQPMQPGEAFLTRFSGTATTGSQGEEVSIDTEGTVGSIVDLRSPGQPPQGHHWMNEPQRQPLKASEVGQVFGVALDGENPPNIYVTATPAFGLHRTSDNKQWMPGMWGPGGPGAVYKLDRANGYRPALFARIALANRPNTGASLGNIAYDRWNRQFFVSDLETGMIHRLRGADGADLGAWDHGAQGRASFLDAEGKQAGSLPPIAFDPASGALINNCPGGSFATAPECWNLAASGRRVWGLGVTRNAKSGEVRLFYSVWSSPAYGNKAWNALPEDQKRNSVWSVRLGPDGGFAGDVRREFLLPDFFQTAGDIERAGYSQPVSDITFPSCGSRAIMLVAERGGLRNLGLAEQNAFAEPNEARLLRYELDHEGVWRAVGRYDVGFRERQPEEGPPAMQANCAGGAAFGYGYDTNKWTIARNQPDQFVWTTGDSLCSSLGPCNAPGIAAAGSAGPGGQAQPGAPQQASDTEGPEQAGDVEVHGIQGIAEGAFQEVAPAAAFSAPGGTTGQQPESAQGSSLNESYMIDADINVDVSGNVDEENTLSNDATMIGDIAIYQVCETPPLGIIASPPPGPIGIGHDAQISHSMYESHGRAGSHFRFGSHAPSVSHNRWQSHYRHWSHYREGSHNRNWTHERRGSLHNRYLTHLRHGTPHNRVLTHKRYGTPHDRTLTHQRFGTPHDRVLTHQRRGTPHDRVLTHKRYGSPHDRAMTHKRYGTPHDRALTHQRTGTPHNRVLTHQRTGTPHNRVLTHKRDGSPHDRVKSHNRDGTRQVDPVPKKQHTRAMTIAEAGKDKGGQKILPLVPKVPTEKHTRAQTHARVGSPKTHDQALSHRRVGSPKTHDQALSHRRAASPKQVHTRAMTHARAGSPKQKVNPTPTHSPNASHARSGSKQKAPPTKGVPQQKGAQQKGGGPPQHTRAASHQRTGSQKR